MLSEKANAMNNNKRTASKLAAARLEKERPDVEKVAQERRRARSEKEQTKGKSRDKVQANGKHQSPTAANSPAAKRPRTGTVMGGPTKTEGPTEPAQDGTAEHPDPTQFVGERIAKIFGGKVYFGSISKVVLDAEVGETLWHVDYDDGDEEEFSLEDLEEAQKLYAKKERRDPFRGQKKR